MDKNEQGKRFDKVEEKLDKVLEEVGQIKVTIARNTADLEHHIRRTELAEENIEMLRGEISTNSKFRSRAEWTFRLIGVIGSGLGLAFAAVKAIEALTNLL